MENLFFVGIKHSGKTTFARRLGEKLSVLFKDSDDLILSSLNGESIRNYYKKEGKESFMEKEYEGVRTFITTTPSPFILSLGGGASDNLHLMNLLKNSGKVIYLSRDEDDMLPVILKDGIPPFLDSNNPVSSFHQLYTRRHKIYKEFSDLQINLGPYGDKDKTLALIYNTLKENGYVR